MSTGTFGIAYVPQHFPPRECLTCHEMIKEPTSPNQITHPGKCRLLRDRLIWRKSRERVKRRELAKVTT